MPAMDNIAGNIFLIGLMGAGKTTQGKHLAALLDYPFIDSDHVICQRTGVNIPTIFELEGEEGFRNRETAILDELTQSPTPILLATGGGAVLRPENRAMLHQRGTVIYLHARPKILFERIRHDKNRPLLQGVDAHAKLQSLYQERDPLYRETAHLVVDVNTQACQQSTQQLLQHIFAHSKR